MESTWATLIVSGLFISAIAPLIASVLCFRLDASKGLAALIIPGYFFIGIRPHPWSKPIIGLWLTGVVAIITGTIALN